MDINSITPRNDNVLVSFIHFEKARQEEEMVNGLFIPRNAHAPKENEAILATVIAAGPGHHNDPFVDMEVGTHPYKSGGFIPMDPAIRPGAKVFLEGVAKMGDRVYGDDRFEYRMVKTHCICAVVEE